MPVIPKDVVDGFEDSFEDIDYEVKESSKNLKKKAGPFKAGDFFNDEQATSRKSPDRSSRFGIEKADKGKGNTNKNSSNDIFSAEERAMQATGMP